MPWDVFTSFPGTLGFAELSTGLRKGSARIQQSGWRHQETWGIWGDFGKIYGWLLEESPARLDTPWLSSGGNGDVFYECLAMQRLERGSGGVVESGGLQRSVRSTASCVKLLTPLSLACENIHTSSWAKENLAPAEQRQGLASRDGHRLSPAWPGGEQFSKKCSLAASGMPAQRLPCRFRCPTCHPGWKSQHRG